MLQNYICKWKFDGKTEWYMYINVCFITDCTRPDPEVEVNPVCGQGCPHVQRGDEEETVCGHLPTGGPWRRIPGQSAVLLTPGPGAITKFDSSLLISVSLSKEMYMVVEKWDHARSKVSSFKFKLDLFSWTQPLYLNPIHAVKVSHCIEKDLIAYPTVLAATSLVL